MYSYSAGLWADSGGGLGFGAYWTAAVPSGRFNVWGIVIGVTFVSLSVSGLTLAGADAWVNPVFNGLELLVAVPISSVLAPRRATT